MAIEREDSRDWIVPPGEILLEALEERSMSQSDLARRMGRPVKTINEIVHAKAAITPETAIQLELALNISSSLWNGLETKYREHLARDDSEKELAAYASWARRFPLADMVTSGLIDPGDSDASWVANLLGFFGVSSVAAWDTQWRTSPVSYRSSKAHPSSPEARAAWLRWGEREALKVSVPAFSARDFRRMVAGMRKHTRKEPMVAIRRIQQESANAGVVVVLTPELPGTRLSGAARWLAPNKAIIQLSLRHKTDDQLWFSFFHEAAHLVADQRRDFVDEEESTAATDDAAEARADRLAQEWLVDSQAFKDFITAGDFSERAVRDFAKAQSVSAGVVVGRLQRDGNLDHSQLNYLKRKVQFAGGVGPRGG